MIYNIKRMQGDERYDSFPDDLLNQYSEQEPSVVLDKILLRELNDLNEKLGREKRDILDLPLVFYRKL